MTRKLVLLNLILLTLAAAGFWRLRVAWQAEKARERTTIARPIRPLPPPPVSALTPTPAVRPADYIDIAQKDLFSRDRNPTIVVETKAPPPKPMPPLPLFHGVMNLGDGPTAILSEKKGAPHRDFRAGEKIGEFKLTAVKGDEIVLEWDGQQIRRRLDEAVDNSAPPPPQSTPEPPPPAPRPSGKPEPGVDVGQGMRACQPGDPSPAGATVDGMRKRVENSPFGQRCWWEPAK